MDCVKTTIALAEAFGLPTKNLVRFSVVCSADCFPHILAEYVIQDEGTAIGVVEREFTISLRKEQVL